MVLRFLGSRVGERRGVRDYRAEGFGYGVLGLGMWDDVLSICDGGFSVSCFAKHPEADKSA